MEREEDRERGETVIREYRESVGGGGDRARQSGRGGERERARQRETRTHI